MSHYRKKILELTQAYYTELDETDFSHNFDHVLRVERLAKTINMEERADEEVIEAACLLFDVARGLEADARIDDHAETGAEIARDVLNKVGFPPEKIDNVCHAIYVHRKSKQREPKTLEAKILQDADYLDAMGAIDVARVIASSLQSKQYKKPVYIHEPYTGNNGDSTSAIHYLHYKLDHPKLQPDSFHTRTAKHLASGRHEFMKEYVTRFIAEWQGEK